MCQGPRSLPSAVEHSSRSSALRVKATKSKGFETLPALQPDDFTAKEIFRKGDQVHVEITIGPEETLKAWNQSASKMQRRTPSTADSKKGITDRAQEVSVKEKAIRKLMMAALPVAAEPYDSKVLQDSLAVAEESKEILSRYQPYQPFTFTIKMQLSPEIRWLTPYTSLQVNVPYLASEEVDRKNAAAKLKELQRRSGTMRVVQGRGCQKGDVAMVKVYQMTYDLPDPTSLAPEEVMSVLQEAMRSKDTNVEVIRVDTELPEQWTAGGMGHTYPPELLEGVIGMQPNQYRCLKAYRDTTKGSLWIVSLYLQELLSWDFPEMNDEWARELEAGWAAESLDALKAKVLEVTQAEGGQEAAQATYLAIAQAVAAAAEVNVPEALLQEVGRMEFQKEATEYMLQAKIDKRQMERMITEAAVNQYIEKQRHELEELVKKELAVQEIFEREGIEVTEQEILAEMTSTAEQFVGMEETFDADKLREQVIETIKGINTLSWVEKHSEIKYVAPPAPIQPGLLDGYVGLEDLQDLNLGSAEFYAPWSLRGDESNTS